MNRLNPDNVTRADLIIGIPSYKEADTIGHAVKQAVEGLKTYFPDFVSVIVNVDNDSPDNTMGAFMKAQDGVPQIYISTASGLTGKGNNLFNLFQEMVRLQARAAVVVPANLSIITPEWIKELASPILNGYDWAAPLYARSEYDGTITNNICYPLIYGLLGKDIRQPIGGDFALSLDLAKHYLKQDWSDATRQYGIDIFMSVHAVLGEFACSQVGLGAKPGKPSAPKLGLRFVQMVETLFQTLLSNKERWLEPTELTRYPLFGEQHFDQPRSSSLDYKAMEAAALREFGEHQRMLAEVLEPMIYTELVEMYRSGEINIDADLWMRIVYELLFAYDNNEKGPGLIEAMKPLYFGRVASFIKQTLDKDHDEAERMIQWQAQHFYRHREVLTQKYVYARAVA